MTSSDVLTASDFDDNEEGFSLPFSMSEFDLGPSLLKRGFGDDDYIGELLNSNKPTHEVTA